MYPEQVKKLDVICKAESKRQGRSISYNQMLVELVERRYRQLSDAQRHRYGGDQAPAA